MSKAGLPPPIHRHPGDVTRSSVVPWNGVYEHVMVGDYNGDGREDIVGRRPIVDQAKLQWDVIAYTADDAGVEQFRSESWETLIDSDQTDYSHVLTADVTGDGRDDIVARIASNGTWVVAKSVVSDSGSERFQTKGWGGAIPDEPLLDVLVGDVDADGDEDLIARTSSDRWWVKVSEGDSSTNSFFGSWSTKNGFVDVNTGDFDGDGLADVAGRDRVDGKWTVGVSSGAAFEFEAFGAWDKTESWSDVMVGDFNWIGVVELPTGGDGTDDGGGEGDGDGSGGKSDDDGDALPGENLQRLTPGTGDWDGDGAADYVSDLHVFSIDDIVGDFAGTGYVDDPSIIDTTGIGDVEPIISKDGVTLYPVDSAFGYYLTDFVGAEQKLRDGVYEEGRVGNLTDGEGNLIGMELSDAETGVFKSGLPLGTWLTGLGGVTVKASTEHYTVMADILGFDDSPGDDIFTQIDLTYNETDGTFTPGANHLRQYTAQQLLDAWHAGEIQANESSVLQDIFLAADIDDGAPIYSVTFKDDGKMLYRWGTAVKRPNDLRMNVSLPVPEQWTETGLTYLVTTANLRVNHKITNNPNDQIRPEDLENELATGRQPSYVVVANPNDPDGYLWVSAVNDYAGDGTWYPSYFVLAEDGNIVPPDASTPAGDIIYDLDGNAIGIRNEVEVTLANGDVILVGGTIFRDTTLADPNGLSADLVDGFTNAWYTTMDRDPFEPNPQYTPDAFDAVSTPNDEFLVLNQAGPRWRLQAGKFGQDLPGVDIPEEPHSRPPFTKDNIKYEVGDDTTTVINLLDGAGELDNGVDLRRSDHWTGVVKDADGNIVDERLAVDEAGDFITRSEPDGSTSYLTINGAWLTEDFDFSIYIKGDRKPTALYDAQLVVEYEILVGIESVADGSLAADIGYVPNVTYAWSVDGQLVADATGSNFDLGAYLASNGLPAGSYVVDLLVTDSHGTTGQTSMTQVVSSSVLTSSADTAGALAVDDAVPADVNRDGDVNFADVLSVIGVLRQGGQATGNAAGNLHGDANEDGAVDFSDVLTLIHHMRNPVANAEAEDSTSLGGASRAVDSTSVSALTPLTPATNLADHLRWSNTITVARNDHVDSTEPSQTGTDADVLDKPAHAHDIVFAEAYGNERSPGGSSLKADGRRAAADFLIDDVLLEEIAIEFALAAKVD